MFFIISFHLFIYLGSKDLTETTQVRAAILNLAWEMTVYFVISI